MLRREFLRVSGLIGLGIMSAGHLVAAEPFSPDNDRKAGQGKRRLSLVGYPGAGCATPPDFLNYIESGFCRLPY